MAKKRKAPMNFTITRLISNKTKKNKKRPVSPLKKRQKAIFNKPLWQKPSAVAFALIFAAIGSYLLFKSFAAITVGSLEAESLMGSGQVVSDTAASAGNSLNLTANMPASGTINTTGVTTNLTLRAKGVQCKGAPQVAISIDSKQVLTANVSATIYTNYTSTLTTPLAAGSHTVSAMFTNPGGKGRCSRAVTLDVITAVDDSPPPPPSDGTPPTVALTTPPNNATVSGTTNISASASDNIGVTRVEFYIDNVLVSTVSASPYIYAWDTTAAVSGTHALRATAYDAGNNSASSANVSVTVVGNSIDDLMSRQDLIYGSEIGAWRTTGNPTVDPSTPIPNLVKAAKIPIIRFALSDVFTDMTDPTGAAGTMSRANFDAAINGIRNNLLAEPFIKLMPIAPDVIGTKNGTIYCPPYSTAVNPNLTQNLPYYKEIVRQAGPRVRLYESNNEMEYTCWAKWRSQGAPFGSGGSVGVSKLLGQHYAQNMPALKKYARSLGFEIKTVGYIGIEGGFNWGDSIATPNKRSVTEFMTAAHDAYVANNNDPDYIPDAISIHAYPYSGDFGYTAPLSDIIAYHDAWAASTRSIINNIWGTSIGSNIKLSISEWNAGDKNWTGFNDNRVNDFYTAFLQMLRRNNFWQASQFAIGSNGTEPYDMIKEDGTTRSQYNAFKAASLADPVH